MCVCVCVCVLKVGVRDSVRAGWTAAALDRQTPFSGACSTLDLRSKWLSTSTTILHQAFGREGKPAGGCAGCQPRQIVLDPYPPLPRAGRDLSKHSDPA